MHQSKRQAEKASPRLWTREVEVSEALAPKGMALLGQQVQARSSLWSQEASEDLLAPSLPPCHPACLGLQLCPGAVGYYCYFAEEFLFVGDEPTVGGWTVTAGRWVAQFQFTTAGLSSTDPGGMTTQPGVNASGLLAAELPVDRSSTVPGSKGSPSGLGRERLRSVLSRGVLWSSRPRTLAGNDPRPFSPSALLPAEPPRRETTGRPSPPAPKGEGNSGFLARLRGRTDPGSPGPIPPPPPPPLPQARALRSRGPGARGKGRPGRLGPPKRAAGFGMMI